jgi:hypothetical protein
MKRSKKILSCSLLFNLLFSTLLVTPLQIHAATQVAEEKQGLQFRLSNAGQPAQPKSTTEPAAAELSVAETRRLLSRLPAMPQEEAQPFALR